MGTVSLEELKRRVKTNFTGISQEIIGDCVAIARKRLPASCDQHVKLVAVLACCDARDEQRLVKGTRALAMIRRDYGDEFENVVRTLTATGQESGGPKRILWMSRHAAHQPQVKALQEMFGHDVEIVQDPNPFDTADVIVERFERGGFDDLVVIAPLSVLDQLCQRGLKPLWAIAVEENDPQKIDFRGARGQGYRFIRFRRVKRLALEFEDD